MTWEEFRVRELGLRVQGFGYSGARVNNLEVMYGEMSPASAAVGGGMGAGDGGVSQWGMGRGSLFPLHISTHPTLPGRSRRARLMRPGQSLTPAAPTGTDTTPNTPPPNLTPISTNPIPIPTPSGHGTHKPGRIKEAVRTRRAHAPCRRAAAEPLSPHRGGEFVPSVGSYSLHVDAAAGVGG